VTSAAMVLHAHVGHWAVSLAIYLGPVLVLAGWLVVMGWRDRRR
jgi:hypothetical protein